MKIQVLYRPEEKPQVSKIEPFGLAVVREDSFGAAAGWGLVMAIVAEDDGLVRSGRTPKALWCL